MRGTRWLLLLAILAIIGGTGALYRSQRRIVQSRTPPKPAALPLDTNSLAFDYEYAQSTSGLAKFKVRARKFRQVGQTSVFELEGVELELQKTADHFDLIKSAKAQFDKAQARMFSEGQVEITLDIPRSGPPPHPLTSIQTSGVHFDNKSGKASTDRPTSFTFQNGHGTCTGAVYDPNIKELHLLHAADLTLQGSGPHSQPMRVQTEELVYREGGSTITLAPWAKMHRAETDVNAGPSIINLKDSSLDSIDAEHAHGTDRYPTRQLAYGADALHMQYSPEGELRQIHGKGSASLHSTSGRGDTTMTGNVFDLDFTQQNNEATLTHVRADGNAVVETIPAPPADPKAERPESKTLRSDTVEIAMRPGGRDIDHVQTDTPGVLEFLPNAPKQHRRLLHGERIIIRYGQQNQIESFESEQVITQTFPAASEKNKTAVPSSTASQHMTAAFHPKTGQLTQMKQWGHFTYSEGPRRASSSSALLDQEKDSIDLQEHARVWDDTGSTDADRIVLNKKSGDMVADGKVNTSRLPDKKKNSSELLDSDQPTQGQASHMTSANHNKLVHYEGDALLWQDTNRIQGDSIDLDRDKHTLLANGHVVTTFVDQPAKKPDAPRAANAKPDEPTAFTVVRSPKLVYTESDRLAHYTGGGVSFERPGLTVHSAELRAWMNPKDSQEDSKINHAFADGKTEILESTPLRQRRGTGEHSEYYAAESRILLRGGEPELVDNQKGSTRGAELTYFTNDDRLLVTGDPGRPVKSTVHRKHAVS